MSNKDLLKLENEFRNEIPKFKEKPKIEFIGKSDLSRRIPEFIAKTSQNEVLDNKGGNVHVEMDIIIDMERNEDE